MLLLLLQLLLLLLLLLLLYYYCYYEYTPHTNGGKPRHVGAVAVVALRIRRRAHCGQGPAPKVVLREDYVSFVL